jgi:tetratricopeptide (TPR) repeat protein
MAAAIAGMTSEAEATIARVSALDLATASGGATLVAGRLAQARAVLAETRGDVGAAVDLRLEAAVTFEAEGAERLATVEWMNTAGRLVELGAYDRARALLDEARTASSRAGLRYNYAFGVYVLGVACSEAGELDEGRRWLEQAISLQQQAGDRRLEGAATYELALLSLRALHLDVADALCRRASELLADLPADLAPALAVWSLVHLARGATNEALAASTRAYEALTGELNDRRALIYLSHVRALDASDRATDADRILEVALAELRRQADAIANDELRSSFWERVPTNRSLVARSRRDGA